METKVVIMDAEGNVLEPWQVKASRDHLYYIIETTYHEESDGEPTLEIVLEEEKRP